jgi:hypothetical protein
MTDTIKIKADGGKVWSPYSRNHPVTATAQAKLLKARRTRNTYFILLSALGMICALIMLIATFVEYTASKRSLKAEGDNLTYNEFNLTFDNLWLPSYLLFLFIVVFVSSLILRKHDFVVAYVYVGISLPTIMILLLTISFLVTVPKNDMTIKMNNLIGEKIGITYQEVVNPNFTGSKNDYYSSNLFIGGDGKYYYLAKEQKGQKVTIIFEEVKGDFNFERNYGLSIKDE